MKRITPKIAIYATISQIATSLAMVSILLANYYWKNGIVENWTPYLLGYLAFRLVVYAIGTYPKIREDFSEEHSRKKYVTAREELVKAMKCSKTNPEDVMLHIRSSIDLAIKEKFGFSRIQPMSGFIKDADEFGLTLPSYDLIYKYFSLGSDRLHTGKINTPFEVSHITKTVKDFIDELERIQMPQETIAEFKNKCKYVQ